MPRHQSDPVPLCSTTHNASLSPDWHMINISGLCSVNKANTDTSLRCALRIIAVQRCTNKFSNVIHRHKCG